MDDNDKETFLLSVAIGWLGAISFLLAKVIQDGKQDQERALEDARTRFFHNEQHQDDDEGGDV